jgi:WXG100 family type VII secretion target
MSEFKVTSSQLTAKAEELNNLNFQFKSQVENLNETEMSLNTMWEGEARNAFHNEFQKDKAQFDNFNQAVQDYIQALQTIAAKYKAAEDQATQIATTRKG